MSFKFNTWMETVTPSPFSVFAASAPIIPPSPILPPRDPLIVFDKAENCRPRIVFEIDLSSQILGTTADKRQEVINNLSQITVFVPEIETPMHHGDRAVLYGNKAVKVADTFDSSILKIISID